MDVMEPLPGQPEGRLPLIMALSSAHSLSRKRASERKSGSKIHHEIKRNWWHAKAIFREMARNRIGRDQVETSLAAQGRDVFSSAVVLLVGYCKYIPYFLLVPVHQFWFNVLALPPPDLQLDLQNRVSFRTNFGGATEPLVFKLICLRK